jgi:hypothetical protein
MNTLFDTYGPTTAPLFNVFLDFDDVINVEGCQRPKNRTKNAPYEDRFDDNPLYRGVEDSRRIKEKVTFYPGAIAYFKTLEARGGRVRWLTTWERDSLRFKHFLGPDFDFGYMPWNPWPDGLTSANVDDVRDAAKLDVVKAATAAESLPFIWVDDSATRLFDAADFHVPALAVRPTKPTGFDKTHVPAIEEFLSVSLME